MAGVRIHHPTERDCTLLIPHPGDPRTGRRPKDYYIHVDADGDAIVSDTVWRRLVEARGSGLSPHGFIALNEVVDPPALMLSQDRPGPQKRTLRQAPDGRIVDQQLHTIAQQFAPRGITPRITRNGD
jgi:hypothetical protein